MAEAVRSALPFTTIQGFLHGFHIGGGASGQVLDSLIAVAPAQIRMVAAACQTGGAGPTTLDVSINGSSIWHNPADRPTLAANTSGKFKSGRVNKSAIQPGDVLVLTCINAGGGSQLVATVALEDPSQRAG